MSYIKYTLSIVILCLSITCHAMPKVLLHTIRKTKVLAYKATHRVVKIITQRVTYPLYFGGSLGYGNTNWSQITTSPQLHGNFNHDSLSATISDKPNGFAYGGLVGYQFSKHFTIETFYTKYPLTTVKFAAANNYQIGELRTNTHSYSLVGKILAPFALTNVYVYADAGIAYVGRVDKKIIALPNQEPNFRKRDVGHFGPSFGFGFAYNLTKHLFTEGSFQYTTGYGKADTTPAEDYIPFVYSLMGSMSVRV